MILDHVRLKPTFLGGAHSTQSWVLAIVHEDDSEVVVHKLLTHELRRVLADPEVLQRFSSGPEGYPLTHVNALAQRIAELQAIVDKRKDPREWDSIQELFHPDMNIADIHAATVALILVHEKAKLGWGGQDTSMALSMAIKNATERLWEGRATQLERDAQQPTEQARKEVVQATTASSPSISLDEAIKRANRRGAAAEILWDMLDNIDTLSDQIKPTDELGYRTFYQKAMNIAVCRHDVMKSDGHTLMWPDDDSVDRIHARYQDLVQAVEAASSGASWSCKFPEHEWLVRGVNEAFRNGYQALRKPVPMLLHCPICHTKHIDEGEFATKAHHTHACQGFLPLAEGEKKPRRCGHVWRPSIVATVGVEALPGFLNEDGRDLIGREVRVLDSPSIRGTIRNFDPAARDKKPYYVVYANGGAGYANGGMRLDRSEFEVLPEDASQQFAKLGWVPGARVDQMNHYVDGKPRQGVLRSPALHSLADGSQWRVSFDSGEEEIVERKNLRLI